MTSDQTQVPTDALEDAEHIVEVFTRESRRHLGADTGFVPCHHWEHDGSRHDAFFTKRGREGFRGLGRTAHDGMIGVSDTPVSKPRLGVRCGNTRCCPTGACDAQAPLQDLNRSPLGCGNTGGCEPESSHDLEWFSAC